jgi:hypothetical protein
MASTYSSLKIELIGTGDQSGTWGTTTNTNLGTAIEEAITGTADVAFSSADVTLTLTDTNSAQTARNLRLNLTGTSGGARNLIVPAIEKQYIINNGLADAVTVKNATGTGVSVPAGKSMLVFNTGTNVVEVVTALATGTVIPVANGGTGASSASVTSFNNITGYTASGATGTTSSNLVFSASPTLTGSPLAPTQTAGDNSTKIATTQYVATAVTNATGSLGTMSTQNASAVAITGGTINSTTVSGNNIYGTAITAGSFVIGYVYTIASVGTTSFTSIGASANTVGITFVATGAGSGTGTAYNYYVGSNSTGAKTVSTSTPSGGNDGDIWYQVS